MTAQAGSFRLLLLTETFRPEVGGGERQAASLAGSLVRRGHAVTIVTRRSRRGLPHCETGEFAVRRIPPTGRGGPWRKWGLGITTIGPLYRLRREYDLVFVSGFRILGVPALLAGAAWGKPVVLKADSVGEMSGEYFRAGLARVGLAPESLLFRAFIRLRNRIFHRADAFVAISRDNERELIELGVPPARIRRIPNSVDTAAFRAATEPERVELRRRLGLPAGAIVVYTGRLVSYKGLPMLLRAWAGVVRSVPDATLVLVGEGSGDIHDCERALREYATTAGLSANLRFAGAVPAVEDWLRAANVFAFPTENEAFGLSLVEAMACGLPAVTTTIGGLGDFVEADRNAVVVPPGDVNGWTDALTSILRDPERATRLGLAARATALRFGLDAVGEAYEALFEQVLARHRSARHPPSAVD